MVRLGLGLRTVMLKSGLSMIWLVRVRVRNGRVRVNVVFDSAECRLGYANHWY